MSSEGNLSETVGYKLRPFGRIERIESPMEGGVPDVYYLLSPGWLPLGSTLLQRVSGWLELKHEHEWPKKEATPLKLKRFTKEQRMWLEKEVEQGGRAWLLLQVDRDYLMFRGDHCRPLFNGATRNELVITADLVVGSAKTFPTKRVLTCLTN